MGSETSGWFKEPVEELADLTGFKMRFFGLGAQVMKKLGVSTQLLAGADIYPALERETIQATEISMPSTDIDYGFHQIAKNNYFPGWHQQTSCSELLMNKAKFDALPTTYKAVVRIALAEILIHTYSESEAKKESEAKNAIAMKTMQSEHGVKIQRWRDDQLATFENAWREVVKEQSAKDPYFKEVAESYYEFRSTYSVWTASQNLKSGYFPYFPSVGKNPMQTRPGGSAPKTPPPIMAASRLFAGPKQFPPEQFPAYGIVVFPTRATSHDFDRHMLMCEAYVSTLRHASVVGDEIPFRQQMVTIWPTESKTLASEANRGSRKAACKIAVEHYGLGAAKLSLAQAVAAGLEIGGQGPYLLAWSPGKGKGDDDVLVLVADLSDVTSATDAKEMFQHWEADIVNGPAWRRGGGWSLEHLRKAIKRWAENYGAKALQLLVAEN